MDTEVQHLVEAWHWMYFEADLLFEGLIEENLHRRPSPNLLAVSEHVAHVVRSEASIVNRYLLGEADDVWADSPLRHPRFGWPPTMLASGVDEGLSAMTVEEVRQQLLTQHDRCYADAQRLALWADHKFDDAWERCCSVRDRLRIAAYHVAYHAGQIYSVRHMLGEETPEN